MKYPTFGALAAGAIMGLVGSAALVHSAEAADETRACYRTQCGKSVKGHEGRCGGTKVGELADKAACEAAGGAWTTAAAAKRFEKKSD